MAVGGLSVPSKIVSDNDVSVFPNPTSGHFTVLLPDDDAEIIVRDVLGREILKTQAIQKITNLELDNSGVYIVYIKTKQGTATRKLIVNR